jgi:hypothetical protein
MRAEDIIACLEIVVHHAIDQSRRRRRRHFQHQQPLVDRHIETWRGRA